MFGQQRSQSGPGGLSINTSSANSYTPLGTSQPGGLFGSTQQAKAGGGLFGSSTNANPQNQQSGGLFGTSTSNEGGGLLGSLPTNNQQQQGGGLFSGQSTQQMSAPPSNQQQSTGLFGSNTQQTQPPKSGGLFGSLGQAQSQNQSQLSQGTGLFGGLNGQSKTPSLLRARNSATQNQQRPSLLSQTSSMNQSQQQSLFSSSIGQYTQQQQTVPGVRISVNELRPTTRFNDLHEELQKAIENVDNFILAQINFQGQSEVAMDKVAKTSNSIPNDVEFCASKLDTMQQALENDAEAIEYAKTTVKADAADAKLNFKAVQALKMPQQFHYSGLWSVAPSSQGPGPSLSDEGIEDGASNTLVSYFSNQADDMSKTLESYKRNITDVELYLKGLESGTMQQLQQMMFVQDGEGGTRSAVDQVKSLAVALKDFENGILGVAGKVGGVREVVQEAMLGERGNVGGRIRRFGPQ